MKIFFRIVDQNSDMIKYTLEKPGLLLIYNIYKNWLRFLNSKTSKSMTVFNKEKYFQEKNNLKLPAGFLDYKLPDYNRTILAYHLTKCTPVNDTKLNFKIVFPKQDFMQYFIQWQRYRKFWWSSITTTPSLFSVNDIKYLDELAKVDVIAQYPWGTQAVETLQIIPSGTMAKNSSCLTCAMSLEGTLLYILQDALTNQNKEEYLRLHRSLAPYKISFALNYGETNNKKLLYELAKLLHLRLKMKNISTWLSDWSLTSELQIKQNLQMGVTYTAILNEQTLENGIFQLLNSSTMLKEEVHISDFDEYATLIFKT